MGQLREFIAGGNAITNCPQLLCTWSSRSFFLPRKSLHKSSPDPSHFPLEIFFLFPPPTKLGIILFLSLSLCFFPSFFPQYFVTSYFLDYLEMFDSESVWLIEAKQDKMWVGCPYPWPYGLIGWFCSPFISCEMCCYFSCNNQWGWEVVIRDYILHLAFENYFFSAFGQADSLNVGLWFYFIAFFELFFSWVRSVISMWFVFHFNNLSKIFVLKHYILLISLDLLLLFLYLST